MLALKHVFRMTWREQDFIFLCLCFVPRVRLKLFEQRGSLLSFLFVAWMDCAVPLWAVKVFCLHNEPHLGRLLLLLLFFTPRISFFFSLWNSHSSASVDTAFSLAFIPLSSRRVLSHTLHQTPHSVLPTWEQRWMHERRMEWSWFTHWWSELVRWAHGAGWWGQIRAKTSATMQTSKAALTLLLILLTLSRSLHLSCRVSSLSSHPVIVRHRLPKISSTVSCRSDVLATISRV